jgi:hypothetical protein
MQRWAQWYFVSADMAARLERSEAQIRAGWTVGVQYTVVWVVPALLLAGDLCEEPDRGILT